ncbi:MAG: hypothetical protein MPN21_02340 [Thermoanaerobaculia bacterium]|nr:hypothetical protein [Thermoanaerobaculia bacterium]
MKQRDHRREELESRLAEGGAGALEHDVELRDWVESDDNAMALLEALVVLDQTFEHMGQDASTEGSDAPDEVVAALLARPELTSPAASESVTGLSTRPPRRRSRFAVGRRARLALAAAASMILATSVAIQMLRSSDRATFAPAEPHLSEQPQSDVIGTELEEEGAEGGLRASGYIGDVSAKPEDRVPRVRNEPVAEADQPTLVAAQEHRFKKEDTYVDGRLSSKLQSLEEVGADAPESKKNSSLVEEITIVGEASAPSPPPPPQSAEVALDAYGDYRSDDNEDLAGARQNSKRLGGNTEVGGAKAKKPAPKKKPAPLEESEIVTGNVDLDDITVVDGVDASGGFLEGVESEARERFETRDLARRWLEQRRRTTGIPFVEPAGYWRNPWLPGDPDLRFLAARLDELGPELPAGLHRLARRPALPFDAPENDALALYLHADRVRADGPSRVTVRVGVRAADAWAGRRTAMNLAVVLHLPPVEEEIPAQTAVALRALLEALAEAHDMGDRFYLFVAGRPGGLLVSADDFRRGSVLVAMRRLLATAADPDASQTDGVDDRPEAIEASPRLAEVLRQAHEAVRVEGDEEIDRPVGSSAILVVTTGSDPAQLHEAATTAHHLSVSGVRVSALGVGSETAVASPSSPDEKSPADLLARIAEAGQGSRRLITQAADAVPAIEDELTSASRAVARAVRLRIRPAPGVQLVRVLDSERLDQVAADRVRRAEEALDLRLARKLGIEADRGEDEEGIQILVPALYAGDAMTLLVDVVAPGPGPLVDVTVRFKDLLRMENGVARARLDLAYGESAEVPEGPLEVSVLKSLLAFEVKSCLEEAAMRLSAGDDSSAAVASIQRCRELVDGMLRLIPGLEDDPDLLRDLQMLNGYSAILQGDPTVAIPAAIEESLRFASKLKTLPPPASHDLPRR